MADDVNKSKRPPPEDAGYDALRRIGRKYSSPGVLDELDRQKLAAAQENREGLEALLEDRPELNKSESIVNGLQHARDTIKRLGPRVRTRRELKRERAIQESVRGIERDFASDSVNSAANQAASGYDQQLRGLAQSGRSQKELEMERAGLLGQVGEMERSAVNIAENDLYDREGRQDPAALESIRSTYRGKKGLTSRIGAVNAALKKQRQLGEDEESKDRSLLATGQEAGGILYRQQVREELKSGQGLGALNTEQLKQKEIDQAKTLVEALDRLRNSAGESAENIEKLKENAKDAAAGLKKTQEAISQGGGGNLWDKYKGSIPGMLNAAAAAGQEVLINQPLQTLANRTGFAQLSNAQYDQRNAAIGGNMTALLAATQNVGNKMTEVGANFKQNADIVRGMNIAAGAITTGLGVGQAVNGAKNAGLSFGGLGGADVVSGVKTAVEGASQTAVSAGDVINQSMRSGVQLQGEQSIFGLNNEINRVRGDFRQSFFDYSMGTRAASLAGGGRVGRSITNQFAGDMGGEGGILGRMQKERISPQDYARLMAEGAGDMGSVFNTESVFTARRLERSGTGSVDTNMSRMAALAGAGANNPQAGLASVLEASFSKGLDGSKAINNMVKNTADMVRTSMGATMLGMDTTSAAAGRLAALTATDTPNREMAAERAKTAAEKLNELNTGIGANFTDMLGISRIANQAGVSSVTAMALKKIDDPTAAAMQQQLEEYQKMSPNQKNSAAGKEASERLEKSLFRSGLGDFVSATGDIDAAGALKGFNARSKSILGSGAFLNLVNPQAEGYQDLMTGKITGEQVMTDRRYQELRGQVAKAATFQGLTEDEVYAQLSGKSGITAAGKAEAVNKLGGANTATGTAMDEAATAQGADMANKARQAAKELGGAAEALGKINKQMQSLVSNLNDKTAGDFQGASAKAAEMFQNSGQTFMSATNKFSESVKLFERIPTSTGDAVKQAIQPIVDKMNSMGGGSDNRKKSGPGG